jgi:hypothetical protein
MKTAVAVAALLVFLSGTPSLAGDGLICPTIPGTTVRDFTKPCLRFEPDSYTSWYGYRWRWSPWRRSRDWSLYPTYPGTSVRDYSKPGLRFDDGLLYPTLPGTTIRDYSRPGLRLEPRLICPTLPGTSTRDYGKACLKID